ARALSLTLSLHDALPISLWVEGMVAGRGWIALALVAFATWRPYRLMAGAYLFGGITILTYHMQALGVPIASQLLSMLPYIATIVVLVLISRNSTWIRLNMPASLGKTFNPNSYGRTSCLETSFAMH